MVKLGCVFKGGTQTAFLAGLENRADSVTFVPRNWWEDTTYSKPNVSAVVVTAVTL